MKPWVHDKLAEDLAIAKGGIPFLNVCLGSAWISDKKTPRADLVVCNPSYNRFCLSIYEVKVSRADFLSDIRSEKWRCYLPYCHRFYFAIQKGVASQSDIPQDAGLIVRGEKGWSTARAAKKLDNIIPDTVLLSLIFSRQRRSKRQKRLDDAQDLYTRPMFRTDWNGRLKSARLLGKEIGMLYEAAMLHGGIKNATKILNNKGSQ